MKKEYDDCEKIQKCGYGTLIKLPESKIKAMVDIEKRLMMKYVVVAWIKVK